MTFHLNVDDETVDMLFEQCAWADIGLAPKRQKLTEESVGGTQQIEEAEEVECIVCPLCESQLEEELSDHQILEHTSRLLESINLLNESLDREGILEYVDSDEPDDFDVADYHSDEDEPFASEKKAAFWKDPKRVAAYRKRKAEADKRKQK